MQVLRFATAVVCVGILGVAGFSVPQAQARRPVVTSARMYVFDAGVLRIPDPLPLFGLKKEEVAASDLSGRHHLSRPFARPRRPHRERQRLHGLDVAGAQGRIRRDVR